MTAPTSMTCPACNGQGVQDTYTPDGPPACPVCRGAGRVSPAVLADFQAQQRKASEEAAPLKPSRPASLAEMLEA